MSEPVDMPADRRPGPATPSGEATEGGAAAAASEGNADGPRRNRRRGSRGGRGRKKKPATEAVAAQDGDVAVPAPKIHVPEPTLGEETAEPVETEPASVNGDAQAEDGEAPKPRKKTRRGSRGGRNRRKKPVAASANGGEETAASAQEPERTEEPASDEYVPMSEWIDEVDTR